MIFRDHSKNKIIEAIENNASGFFLLAPPNDPMFEINEMNDMIQFTSEINHPMGNWILKVRFNAKTAEERIAEIMKFYHERKLAMMWWITPSSTPKNILGLLGNAGLQISKRAGMACDLRDLTQAHLERALKRIEAKIEVMKVTTSNNLKLWGRVFQEGFSLPNAILEMFLHLFGSYEKNYMNNYIAKIQEQPVAIASVLYYGGIAGIYNIATLPSYRRLGIGTAITLAPLLDAKKKGYEIACLESSEMGQNLYTRIGFKEYCKIFRCFFTFEG